MCRAKVQARTCHFHNSLEGNSNNNSSYCVIVRVRVVLKRTVVGD